MKNRTRQKLSMMGSLTLALVCLGMAGKGMYGIIESDKVVDNTEYQNIINAEFEELQKDSEFIQYIDIKLDDFYQNEENASEYDNVLEHIASWKSEEAMLEYMKENDPESYANIQDCKDKIDTDVKDDPLGVNGNAVLVGLGTYGAVIFGMEVGRKHDEYMDERFNHDENEMQ